ncbi:MAG: cytidine/deoxycytidylate deaminase family protein [Coriobacteriales bacterium]|nr:cytidine/deoxycytidylate deaminase family protein [Coriobacteriales bacterium]
MDKTTNNQLESVKHPALSEDNHEVFPPETSIPDAPVDNRPSWDEYFMQICHLVASRTTCLRRAVGAVIVKDHRILATGYNGVPKGIEHCLTRGCLRTELGIPSGEHQELCRGVHAEENAIIQAARYGISIEGATCYVTTQPCVMCSKSLINAGIREIVFAASYPDKLTQDMLDEAKIVTRRYTLEK